MTWAKLDDGITETPAMLKLDRGIRLVHLEAIVWACRHETDGHIASHVLRRMTDEPDCDGAASALVDVGLWEQADDGWQIVGFLDHQRSAEDIARARALTAERQRRHRQHTAGDHSLCDPRYCKAASRVSNGVTDKTSDQTQSTDPSRVTDTVSNDPPSRPVPTRPDPNVSEGSRSGAGSGSAGATPLPPLGTEDKIAVHRVLRDALKTGTYDASHLRLKGEHREVIWELSEMLVQIFEGARTWKPDEAAERAHEANVILTERAAPVSIDPGDLGEIISGTHDRDASDGRRAGDLLERLERRR